MLLLLFFLLVILAVIAFCVNGRDVLSPSFLLIVFFIIGTFFAFYGNLSWNIEINDVQFIIAIIGGLASILCGEMIAIKKGVIDSDIPMKILCYSYKKTIFLIVINALIVYLFYQRVLAIAVATGFSGENLLMYVRAATSLGGVKFGLFFTIFIWIVQASAFIFIYIFFNNFFIQKKISPSYILLLIPVIIYFIQVYLSGARAGLVRFFIMVFFLFFFLYRQIHKKINIFKALVIGLSFLSILLYSFALLGTFTKKVDEGDFLNPICIYTGSSIIALDDWLQRDQIFSIEHLGTESFSGVLKIGRFLQGEKTKIAPDGSNFVRKGKFSTNIYTGFRAYLSDFGWLGLFIICFFLGLVFRYAYQYVLKRPTTISVLIYTYFFIDFLYLLFAQSITSNLMTPTSFMGIVWIILVYFFMYPKKG